MFAPVTWQFGRGHQTMVECIATGPLIADPGGWGNLQFSIFNFQSTTTRVSQLAYRSGETSLPADR
jgi:hypothetical protein